MGAGPALSTSGYSSYQNPLLNQSINGPLMGGLGAGTGAMSVHSGYGGGPGLSHYGGSAALNRNDLHNNMNPSTARSEANLNNVGVQNPLLTIKPQTNQKQAPQSQNQFQFNKTLYESQIHIRMRCQDREDYVTCLNIKMIMHAPNTSSAQTQILTVELTDEEDPYFVYTMDCSEQDYHILKNEQ